MKGSSIVKPRRTIIVIAGMNRTTEAMTFEISLMRYPLDYENTYWQVIAKKVCTPTLIPLESGTLFRAKEIYFHQDGITFVLFPEDEESYVATLPIDGIWSDGETFSVNLIEKISNFTIEAPFGDFHFEQTTDGWDMTRKNVGKGSGNSPAHESKNSSHYSVKLMLVKGTLGFSSLRLVGNGAILYEEGGKEICALEINRII